MKSYDVWKECADSAQKALRDSFWNPTTQLYEPVYPASAQQEVFHYWWQAHAIDALLDAFQRTREAYWLVSVRDLVSGVVARNGGDIRNEFYDDMQWMALALLRAYKLSGGDEFLEFSTILWEDIKTGWNGHCGGGIAWKKDQLDYKNTPANAPAVILATRRYRMLGNREDLEWAKRIYSWLTQSLVNPTTGFVWDGINRLGDGQIDKDWKFTYCQGVYIGASIELYCALGETRYLTAARRSARTALAELISPTTGLLPDEGHGDGGLFKGILIRYLGELLQHDPSCTSVSRMIGHNAEHLWMYGRDPVSGLFSSSWTTPPTYPVHLSSHLSGLFLFEEAARCATSAPSTGGAE